MHALEVYFALKNAFFIEFLNFSEDNYQKTKKVGQ
jgi:hypothetical protein|tara:strand:- start:345 stop:449 length:105 start_codon:yes stop_codon:yes gene_type:complete